MIIEKEWQLYHTKLTTLCSKNIETKNTDDTIVLALHGWLDNAASFDNLMKANPTWKWCAVDFCGHGLSDHRPNGCFYHLWDYVLDIVALIDLLNVEGANVCLIGHSMGGAVAMLITSVVPEKIKQLILLDNLGPFTAEPNERVVRLKQSIRAMEKIQNKQTRYYSSQQKMIEARMNGFTSLGFKAAEKLVVRGSEANASSEYTWRHDPKLKLTTPFSMDEESVAAFAEKIVCPTLLLLAKDGVYSTNKNSITKRENFFNNKTVEWLEGNHHFHLEDETSDKVISSIKHFIET